MSEYQSLLEQTRSLLRSGDVQEAFQTFRPVLSYPGLLEQPAEFSEALHVFAEISTHVAGPEFANLLRAAAENPTAVPQLYRAAFEMIEYGLSELAATILAYAHRLEPSDEAVLNELAVALEMQMRYSEAQHFLQQAPELVQQHFLTCYLLAFTSVMSGDLETARRLLPDLQRLQAQDTRFAEMTGRIATQLKRADALKAHTPLDTRDLRGWHLVLTGGLLLHLSPYGFDEGMNGRYAWMQDSYELCRQGIQRVQAVLDTLQMRIPCIWLLPDRNSQILAYAAAQILAVPVKPWPADGSQDPGLIVAYDLSQLDGQTLVLVRYHHPNQILWSHATCWTEDQPLAADLTTFLYQTNTQPWGERLIVDPENRQTTRSATDERDPEQIAAELVKAHVAESLPEDEPQLLALTRAAAGEDVLALLSKEGQRTRQWAGSPVPSSFFS